MPNHRKSSLAAGVCYLLTFVSIPSFVFYDEVRNNPAYLAGAGHDTLAAIGAILEVIVALAGIGTAVALFPVVKRQNEGVALGFVATRTLEAAAIFAGVVALMTLVTLREGGAGGDALAVADALRSQYVWTTLLGQGMMPAFNAFLLGYLMFSSRLIPRFFPVFGFIGAPILLASLVGSLLGVWDPNSPLSAIAALCLSVWEFGMGVWLVVKGFNPAAVARLEARTPR